ncbi:LysR family transcriptional regulator [Aestuariivirga sp.]|uniref:LysR family transcriptional regulator n=1 Tax=Aestuariivirga sp. TaxID=2650926 RepID=UPI0039E3AE28
MNLDELRTFLAVVETGSMVAASKRLHVTPSTVTARLDGLEEELGQKLLHRNKSGAELTSPGFKFRRYAEVMVQLWRQARSEISLPKGFAGVCNVGLEFDLWENAGQRFLDHVRNTAPDIAVALWPGEQRQIDRWLAIGLVDIAFCYAPQPAENFSSRALFDDALICVSPRADARPVESDYVYVDHGEEFRRRHAEAFPGELTSALTIASSAWALDHILRHGGTGYLPRRLVAGHLAAATLFAVENAPAFSRRVYVVENASAVAAWPWYADALWALSMS